MQRQSIGAGIAARMQPEGWIAALFAIATAMMLQASRVFVSYLVLVIDQSQRLPIAIIAITVFAFPIVCWLLIKIVSPSRLIAAPVIILAATRLLLQLIQMPEARLILGGLAIIGWGMAAVLFVSVDRRAVAAGLVMGFALDLAFRTLRGSLDLPWTPGYVQTLQVILALAIMVSIWWLLRDRLEISGSTWRSAGALSIIGPAIAIFHLVTGNVAFVSTHTGLSEAGSSGLLAAGMALGIGIAVLRLLAINLIGDGGGPLIGRFILFDAVIGAVTLGFAWGSGGLTILGALFATVTATELLLFALAAEPQQRTGNVGPAAVLTTAGLLLQFVVLFLYYTFTGSGLMLGIAWAGLVAGTLISAISLTSSVQRRPIELRAYLVPFVVVGAFLGLAILWADTRTSPSEVIAGNVDEITVITYNIQSGFSRDNYWDLERTAEVIESSGADVVFLQEVNRGWLVMTGNDQLRWLGRRLDMPYAWGPASGDDLWGNAILSRYPITSEKITRYDSTENLQRSAIEVKVRVNPNFDLTAIATHLDNPRGARAARSEQVDQLIDLLDVERPTILAGDFNMDPEDLLIQDVIQAGLIDAASDAGVTDSTSEAGRRIDYVFVTDDFEIERAQVVDTDASDHRPVVVTLRFTGK